MSGRSIDHFERGFTLIEVMLALSIFALMGAILYGAFSLSHRVVDRSQAAFERNQQQRSSVDLLGSYIRSTHPYRPSLQDAAVFYDGQPDELTFVSSFSLTMGGRGMSKIHILWDRSRDDIGPITLEEEVPVRLDSDSDPGGYRNSIVLQEDVKDVRLAYLDPTTEEEKWEERWDAKEKRVLPRAVRLSYRNRMDHEIRWVFPVMITVLMQ
jgi:prepilin-type N-terminal cleavage/methylation domain-containing protein